MNAPNRSPSFVRLIEASMPSRVRLPEPIVAALGWLEDNGHVLQTRSGPYASVLSPDERSRGARSLRGALFRPMQDGFDRHWLSTDDPAAIGRLASFVQTGGDGSSAGIWVDDDGRQQIVHLGSGSGSIWMNVITDDPVDLLRLLAIGYDELCWPEVHALTPEEAWTSEMGRGDGSSPGWVAPAAFRSWVETTYAVTVPRTARDIVPTPHDDHGNRPDDPFGRWLDRGR